MKKLILLLIPMALILTGCMGEINEPITPESTGLWNQFLIAVSYILIWLSDLLNNSMALAIVALTIIIRMALFPLYKQQLESTSKMQQLKPEMDKITKKYPNDKVKQQQEQQALFKRVGFNPFAGCLPMFVQLFILIVFYQTITRLVLGDGEINGLAAFGAENVSTITMFGTNIAEPAIFWAVMAAATMFLSTWLTQKVNPPQSGQGIQKMMIYVFPIMILLFGLVLPSALTIYWATANVIMMLQVFLTYRTQIINNIQRKN